MSLKRDHAFYWDSCSFFQLAMSYGRTLPLHLYVILFLFMCGPTFNIRCGENLLNEKIIDTQGVVVWLSDIPSKMTFCPEMFFIFLPLTEEQLQRAELWR